VAGEVRAEACTDEVHGRMIYAVAVACLGLGVAVGYYFGANRLTRRRLRREVRLRALGYQDPPRKGMDHG
jgi:hypothetical protein